MAKKFPPGWYPIPDGRLCLWDGKDWTNEFQPAPPTNRKVGWHLESEGIYRWWLGDHWSPARATIDNRVDVQNSIGQALLKHETLVGASTDADPLDILSRDLNEYPPCRIEVMTSHTSSILRGTILATVISWVGPNDS